MDKPRGLTSHDVVARVRRLFGGAKVGHAGTLDPDATGVLVLCVGRATKISAFLMEGEKEYVGVGRLGIVTDTQDATGRVLAERPVEVGPEDVRRAARELTGRIEQTPPMFSAVKVDGQRLYRLARKGREVERPVRTVTVHAFDIQDVELPEFRFRLRCSKGTYVRTLVHDLGGRLGCGAHLSRLVRQRQGTFALADALAWETLGSPAGLRAAREASVPPEQTLAFLPERRLGPGALLRRAGEFVACEPGEGSAGELVRLLAPGGAVRGVGRVSEAGVRLLYLFPPGPGFGRGGRRP